MPSSPVPPAPPAPRFRPDPPVVIGLMGGVAAGKSAVAAAFARRGLVAVDADAIARAVARQPEIVAAVAAAMGPKVVGADGQLDRPTLGALVFADPAARKQLEAITHPRIRAQILAAIEGARQAGTSVLLDAPLLLEGGLIDQCDRTVFVAASAAARAQRAASRGWDQGELQRREAAQAPLEHKRARADFSIDNDGPLDAVQRQVDDLLDRLARPRS